MSAQPGVITLHQKSPLDRRSVWFVTGAVAATAALVIGFALVRPAPTRPVTSERPQAAVQSLPAVTGTGPGLAVVGSLSQGAGIPSTRPFSDAAYSPAPRYHVPTMRAFLDSSFAIPATRPAITSIRPLSDGSWGGPPPADTGTNENAPAATNCHQCR